jgi:murein DD-endopeptidase MepM/ murein hydrolase activator NlpD
MNKGLLLLLIASTVFTSITHSQSTKLTTERKENGAVIYASNPDPFPNTIELKLDITNMNFSEGSKTLFLIPARAEKLKIGELTMAEPKAYRYGYTYRIAMGDIIKKQYDQDYPYDLPFPKGKTFLLFQGYNGNFSHQNEKAIDFTMPIGTDICAAREGTVVQLVQNNSTSCPRQECQHYAP